MDQVEVFRYHYSAPVEREVLDIRAQYLPRRESSLDRLKRLDEQVRKPAYVFAFSYGPAAALVLGAGMSMVLTGTGDMVSGTILGLAGLMLTLSTYPIYRKILDRRKKRSAPQILELSEKIMKGQGD